MSDYGLYDRSFIKVPLHHHKYFFVVMNHLSMLKDGMRNVDKHNNQMGGN